MRARGAAGSLLPFAHSDCGGVGGVTLRDVPDFVSMKKGRVRRPALSLLASKRELAGYDQLRATSSWWSVWVLLVLGLAVVGRPSSSPPYTVTL